MYKMKENKTGLDESNRTSFLALSGTDETRSFGRDIGTKLSVSGRRGFLKTLSSLGISVSALRNLSTESLAASTENPKKEVPYIAQYRFSNPEKLADGHPGEHLAMEPVTETLPRDRWLQKKAAHKASRALFQQIHSSTDNIPRVSTGITTIDGEREVVVARYLSQGMSTTDLAVSNGRIESEIPSKVSVTIGDGSNATTVTDIPVRFEEIGISYTADWSYNTTYRPVPGGCKFQNADTDWINEGGYPGTIAQPVYNSDKAQYELLTAGHLMTDNQNGGGEDYEQMHQPHPTDNKVGTFSDYEWSSTYVEKDFDGNGSTDSSAVSNIDAGTYDIDDGDDYRYALAASGGGYRVDITGYWTWNKITSEEDTGWQMYKQGAGTEITQGGIFYTDTNRKWFACYASNKDGDSGAPFYQTDSTGANTAGVVSVKVDLGNDGSFDGSGGNSLDHILDVLGLWFN